MGLVGSQSLADRHYEQGVVGWDAETRRLQQLALYLKVKGASQSTQQVVSCRPECGRDNKSDRLTRKKKDKQQRLQRMQR